MAAPARRWLPSPPMPGNLLPSAESRLPEAAKARQHRVGRAAEQRAGEGHDVDPRRRPEGNGHRDRPRWWCAGAGAEHRVLPLLTRKQGPGGQRAAASAGGGDPDRERPRVFLRNFYACFTNVVSAHDP
ncbi:hypothetical protein PVAP13_7KG148055 [Panicum virgatum]|uniref:Uncharacterized protein n=1 Tax=Panicum virgatum TaxID=38727 RepID=A0A8T0QM80_PANVG|nr:hypothetical protein PVAP13_7KG148055 [Panicum virgatum]